MLAKLLLAANSILELLVFGALLGAIDGAPRMLISPSWLTGFRGKERSRLSRFDRAAAIVPWPLMTIISGEDSIP